MKNISREPIYSSREKYKKNHGLGDTYIEVNLTEQHLYYYQDGRIVVDSPIVLGKDDKKQIYASGSLFFDLQNQR